MVSQGFPPILNTLRPRYNGRHFPYDIFKCILLNENVWISINIALKFVPKSPINNIPALVQIMAWCCSGDKPLSEPMMVILLMHICITWPQWVKLLQKINQWNQWGNLPRIHKKVKHVLYMQKYNIWWILDIPLPHAKYTTKYKIYWGQVQAVFFSTSLFLI